MSRLTPNRRLLIVSPHFPPLNAPDHQRVRMSLPHYAACGWEPVVLCIARDRQSGVIEEELAQTLPAGVRIIEIKAFSPRWTRLIGVGNAGLRCWLPMLFAGLRLLRREKFDLVFFSTTQFFTFTLGRIWRRLRGVPYVFDMQDPWRTDYYQRPGSRPPPGGWKYRFARLVAWTLEGWSFRRVSGVMSVSPDYIADLRALPAACRRSGGDDPVRRQRGGPRGGPPLARPEPRLHARRGRSAPGVHGRLGPGHPARAHGALRRRAAFPRGAPGTGRAPAFSFPRHQLRRAR
jgi:Glycosyl transferase 4-like domain